MEHAVEGKMNIGNQSDLTISFPWGIPGLEDYKEFTLSLLESGSFFYFLQSTTGPEVGLLIVNPFAVYKDYEFDLSEEVTGQLKISGQKQVAVLCTVNTSKGIELATVNLLAPIVINTEHLLAKQVVLNDKRYSFRTPLNPAVGREER